MSDVEEDDDPTTPEPIDPVLVQPLAKNTIWKDVTPIPQDDGPDPVVPIAYRAEFREVMDYFRAILKSNEMSERALKLTRAVINGNAANYTAWHFRRLCMFHLKSDLESELKWVEHLASISPKNYQLWHHRRVLLTHLNKPLNDIAHTAAILKLDAKNYHVWSHRQWLLQTFGLWANELAYVDSLLTADIRNNSAWNQRHFVLTHYWGQPLTGASGSASSGSGGGAKTASAIADGKSSAAAGGGAAAAGGPFSAQTISDEIQYTAAHLRKAPNNESAWNYLEGLMQKPHYSSDVHGKALIALADEIIKLDTTCRFAYALLFEVYEHGAGDASKHAAAAHKVVTALAEQLDPIRNKYWLFRRDNFGKPLPALQPTAPSASTASAAAGAGAVDSKSKK